MRSARVRSRCIPREGTPGGTRVSDSSSTWEVLGAPLAAASLVAVATLASLAIASSSATPGVDFSPRHPLLGGAPYRDVRIPTRGISMHRASRPSDFCALRDVHPRGSWRGRDSGSVPKSTLSVEWPTEEGVARSRAACETPLIRRLQDSGEFVDAFCFVVHPGSTTKLGRVDFDVEPLCDSSYNFNKDVVPGVPAFLAVAATRLTCQVTALVGMYDLDGLRENSGYAPLPEETQRALAAARTPLLVHQTASFDERSATWMPDFYFLRSRGFREGGFGDATLEEMGVAGGGEVGGREEALERIRARWRRKRRSAFWRGSPTGRGRCEDFERLRLASLSRSVDGLDAGLIRDGNNYFCGDDSLTRMLGERWWADEHHVSERDWLEHRAIIDVDGVANAWGRYWRLASDSVVVSLESPIRGFYSDRMVPWKHYVPATLDTIEEAVRWVLDDANENAQIEMIAAANELARSITFESEALKTGERLNRLFCERDDARR